MCLSDPLGLVFSLALACVQMKLQGGGWKVMWEVGVRRIKARVGGKEGMGVGKPVAEIERGAVVETGWRGTQPDYISQCPLHLGELCD